MTIEEAKAILAKAEARTMPIYGPHVMFWEGLPSEGAWAYEVEGSFTAEEFEAMALILRDAERRNEG